MFYWLLVSLFGLFGLVLCVVCWFALGCCGLVGGLLVVGLDCFCCDDVLCVLLLRDVVVGLAVWGGCLGWFGLCGWIDLSGWVDTLGFVCWLFVWVWG